MKIICPICGKYILCFKYVTFIPNHKEVESTAICYGSGRWIEDKDIVIPAATQCQSSMY